MIWLSILSAAAASPVLRAPSICVTLAPGQSHEMPSIEIESLVAALQARMDSRRVPVAPCRGDTEGWVVTLAPFGARDLLLRIAGPDVSLSQRVSSAGVPPDEIVQRIALHAAEAVRPAVDTILAELGNGRSQLDEDLALLESLDPPTPVEPVPAAEKKPPESGAASGLMGVLGGPLVSIGASDVTAYGEFLAEPQLSAWPRPTVHCGIARLPHKRIGDLEFSGEVLQVGLGVQWHGRGWELGVRAQARLTVARVSGSTPVRHLIWNDGLAGQSTIWGWRWGPVDVGLAARGWLWRRPRRVIVRGEDRGYPRVCRAPCGARGGAEDPPEQCRPGLSLSYGPNTRHESRFVLIDRGARSGEKRFANFKNGRGKRYSDKPGRGADMAARSDSSKEHSLVARAQGGDERAFLELYRQVAPSVSRRLLRVLGQPQEVEDVLQTTFLEVHRSLGRYEPIRPFSAWVHGVATHVVGRHLRKRKRQSWLRLERRGEIESTRQSRYPTSEEETYAKQLATLLYLAMDRLKPKKRVAFALAELEGLGVTEIAELVGASPQSVWARVQSARRDIQSYLAEVSIDHPGIDHPGSSRDS